MATNMYLNFGAPIKDKGECTDANHKTWIEIMSWNHSFNQPTSPIRSSAGGGTVERANHSDFGFSKYVDSATDDLLKMLWTGMHIPTATVECFRSDGATGNAVKYLVVDMEQVVVSNYSISAGQGDVPVENISLSYAKVKYTYQPQKEEGGTAEGAQPISHDLMKNEVA